MNNIDKNLRSKYWTFILYEDSDTLKFNDFIDYIKQNYIFLYIKHDKDFNEFGEIKKPHYHVVLKFDNYKWLSALSGELGIPGNFFEPVHSMNAILMYLIHFNQPEKYQYSINDVVGSLVLKNKLIKLIKNESLEEAKVLKLYDFISNSEYITLNELVKFALNNNLWSEFRRSSLIFIKLLEEHNKIYYNYRKE